MKENKDNPDAKQLYVFYILIYLSFYGTYFLLYELSRISGKSLQSFPVVGIALWGIPLLLSFIFCVILSKKYEGKFELSFLGMRREGFLASYLISSALGLASMVILIMEIRTIGYSSVSSSIISAGFVFKPLYLSIPFSALMFLLISIIAFSIWMAYPLRLLSKVKSRKRTVLIVAALILWILLFDQTLFTAQISPGDLLLFDIIFAFLFLRYGNAYGLIAGYLFTGEWIVMAIPASIGEEIFDYVLYVRIAIAIVSIAIIAFFFISGRGRLFYRNSYT